MSRLDFLLVIFPLTQLTQCPVLTNRVKKSEGDNNGRNLNCFGILILMSKFEFCKRKDLWTNTSKFSYISALALGETGMPR